MKPNTKFCLGDMPRLFISHQDLERIKYIVDLAPKEAQWFCRVDKVKSKNRTYFKVYDMFVPEQYCSSAEVESDPMMLVKFFKELKEKYGLEQTNEIMSNMTAWCHSHHNMGVSPSGQDITQFNENIENAKLSGQTSPQMMFIFNKKDQYHLRIWDPETDIIYQNLNLEILPYDFSYLDEEAKTKFKKKVVKAKKTSKNFIHNKSNRSDWDFLGWGMDEEENESSNARSFLINEYINIGLSTYPSLALLIKKYKFKNKSKANFMDQLIKELSIEEIQMFHLMLDLDVSVLYDFEPDENYLIEDNFQEILEDLEGLDLNEDDISIVLIFVKFMNDNPKDTTTLIEEFQSVVDDDLDKFVSTYY